MQISLQIVLRTSLVVVLSSTPFLVVLIHQHALRRQRDILQMLPDPVRQTFFWDYACNYLDRRKFDTGGSAPSSVAYWSSLGLICLIMLLSWSFALDAPFGSAWYVEGHNFLLSGPAIFNNDHDLKQFQVETLGVSVVAFVVAYVNVIFQIAVRLNTNDSSALEHVFDAIHLASAILVSAIGAIVFHLMSLPIVSTTMFAIVAGLQPDLGLGSLYRLAFGTLTGPRGPLKGLRTPERKRLPSALLPLDVQLDAIDGINEREAAKLRRIDVGTCHRLAFNNPFVIWVRTSSSLLEVTDWFGQALLLLYFPNQAAKLRGVGVRTIMDLIARAKDGSGAVLKAMNVDAVEAERIVASLRQIPQIAGTLQLAEAFLDHGRTAIEAAKRSASETVSEHVRDSVPIAEGAQVVDFAKKT
jgi:hypothetical protein